MSRLASRRLGGVVLVMGLVAAAVFGLVALLSARDRSDLAGLVAPATAEQPGSAQPDRGDVHLPAGTLRRSPAVNAPTSGPHTVVALPRDGEPLSPDALLTALERGNVVIAYGDPRQRTALRAVAERVAGPFTPSLAAAGEAVMLDPLAPGQTAAITALAWRRRLRLRTAADPRLVPFISYWLGRGAASRSG